MLIDKEIYFKGLVFISESLVLKGSLLRELLVIYNKNDKAKYYEASQVYFKSYNFQFQRNGTLEREININRILGILVAAEEKTDLKIKIIKIIERSYPEFSKINFRKKEFAKQFFLLKNKQKTTPFSNALVRIGYYLLIGYFGYEFEPNDFMKILIKDAQNNLKRCVCYDFSRIKMVETAIEKSKINISNLLSKYGVINECNDFQDIMNILDEKVGLNVSNNNRFKNNMPLESIQIAVSDLYETTAILSDFEKLSFSLLLGHIELSKNDFKRICFIVNNIEERDKYLGKNEFDKSAYIYLMGIIILSLLKEYKRAKEFYHKNNDETIVFEKLAKDSRTKKLEEEIERLNKIIKAKEEEKSEWENRLNSKVADVQKEQFDRIKELKTENKILKDSLESQEEKNYELARLQELAFSLQHEDEEYKQNMKPLNDLLANKKVVIFGGHEDWHRHLKSKFPNLITLSGNINNIDTNIFLNSDLVIFYWKYSMPHSAYFKVKGFLYNNKIAYMNLGVNNIDKVESEISKHEIFNAKNN